jgi:hypothetical protein
MIPLRNENRNSYASGTCFQSSGCDFLSESIGFLSTFADFKPGNVIDL